jgi:hypothetical protein
MASATFSLHFGVMCVKTLSCILHLYCSTNKENVHTLLHRIGYIIDRVQSKYQMIQMPFSSVFLKSLLANAWKINWHMHHYLLLDNTWFYSSFLLTLQNLVTISYWTLIQERSHNCGYILWFHDRNVICFDTWSSYMSNIVSPLPR